MPAALARHDALLTAGIQQHGGVVVKSRGEGDSLFAVFAQVNDAVATACALQQVVAGTGVAGFSGDNGAATAAQLNDPLGLAVDSQGNLFIADSFNHRVRRLATDGSISTAL